MDKIRHILSSATGNKKVGPPVPPRPLPATVQKALEKTRNISNNITNSNNTRNIHSNNTTNNGFSSSAASMSKGRIVVYTSNNNKVHHTEEQQASVCENKCFDTKLSDSSSTGLKVIQPRNGNIASIAASTARVHENNSIFRVENETHLSNQKSPVPKPRLLPKLRPSNLALQSGSPNILSEPVDNIDYPSSIPRMHRPKYEHVERVDRNERNQDDELKEKLLNEIFSGRLVETANSNVRLSTSYSYKSNLKRSSSCDVLNDRNSIIEVTPLCFNAEADETIKDRKVIFHEMLISELSQMRTAENNTLDRNHRQNRLSLAKSCSDLSPNSSKQIAIIAIHENSCRSKSNNNCFISLEDSGVEDEEKADDCSSSGVGDSWDSCREMQNRVNTSFPGLPPLPKSFCGIELIQGANQQRIIQTQYHQQQHKQSQNHQNSNKLNRHRNEEENLDIQLALLKKEMYSLRQLDLSLLSQLFALNESIQEFRTIIEQENFTQPSPSNSDLNSLASDDEEIARPEIHKKVNTKKTILMDLPKSDKINIRRMNISPPVPPLSSMC